MKLSLTILLIACGLLVGCKSSAKPTPEQTSAALDKFIKQDNPDATLSVSGVDEGSSGDYFGVKFNFTDFSFKDKKGDRKSLSSGKGSASFQRSAEGKWILDVISIDDSVLF